jgi:DNA-binding transcriptional MerR regulator
MSPQKPVKKFFKIGEVSEYSGLSRSVINYYTALGILPETARTKSGHRLYDEKVFDRIDRLRELRTNRTLREVADLLQNEERLVKQDKTPDAKDS